jgi:glycolate oxidase FAD binding subunit
MKPANEMELSEAVRAANGPLRIVGGGTRAIGAVPDAEVLDISGLSGISLYEPGALTMVAGAGTPLGQIEAALAKENQRLAFEPPDMRRLLGREGVSTIGGVVAANASGPRRIQVGACRDHVLGVRFVDGQGTVIKNGGRVMKNVTGYDLVKLLAGSHGSLGVLSEVSFKVLPCPETEATVIIHDHDISAALQAMAQALGSPFDVSGAAHGPAAAVGEFGKTWLRVEGFAASVAYRCQRLTALLAGFGEITVETDPAKSAKIWRSIRDVPEFSDAAQVVRMSLKPSDFSEFNASASRAGQSYRFMLDWGGGLAWLAANKDQPDALAGQEALDGFDDASVAGLLCCAQDYCAKAGGHASLIKGSVLTSHFQPEPPGLATLSAALRSRFDPRGILNPGLMTSGSKS